MEKMDNLERGLNFNVAEYGTHVGITKIFFDKNLIQLV